MRKVWATLASVLFVNVATGQAVEMDATVGTPMPPAACEACPPDCAPCWNLSIPKHPLRTWLRSCDSVQKCASFLSYRSTKCGASGCCPKPDPHVPPPLYTYFWPIHCVDGGCYSSCSRQGLWNVPAPVVDEGFASAGVPVGTPQHAQATPPAKDQSWYKSMMAKIRSDKQVPPPQAIVPVSATATGGRR
jgi:hypothetical protein